MTPICDPFNDLTFSNYTFESILWCIDLLSSIVLKDLIFPWSVFPSYVYLILPPTLIPSDKDLLSLNLTSSLILSAARLFFLPFLTTLPSTLVGFLSSKAYFTVLVLLLIFSCTNLDIKLVFCSVLNFIWDPL